LFKKFIFFNWFNKLIKRNFYKNGLWDMKSKTKQKILEVKKGISTILQRLLSNE